MHTTSSLSVRRLFRGKPKADTGIDENKRLRVRFSGVNAVLTMFLISLFFCGIVNADYFSPALPESNIASQTFVSAALTTPSTTIYINVTEYDAQQMVENITIGFREPVSYVSLVIDLLREKPLIVNAPTTGPIIQYYNIRYLTELVDKITNVTIAFAVEKATLQDMSVEEDSVLLYQYNGSRFGVCPIQRVGENKTFLFFETETTTYPLFAITGTTVPTSLWSFFLPIAVIAILAIIGIYIYKRYRPNRLRNPVRT